MKKNQIILAICFLILFCVRCKKENINEANTKLCIDNICDPTADIMVISDGKSIPKVELITEVKKYKDNEIIFSVSNGSLAPINYQTMNDYKSSLTVSANNGRASCYLIPSKTPDDYVTVSAMINDKLIERRIKYIRSCPDSIYITTESYLNQTTDKVKITSHLINSKTGYVSNDIPTYFSASSNNANLLLQIAPVVFSHSELGNTIAEAELNNLNNDTGRVEIIASTINQSGTKISNKYYIKFQ